MQNNHLKKLPSSKFSAEEIGFRFDECVNVMQKLPGGASLGTKTFWPEINYTDEEISKQEKRKVTPLRPLPEAIDRAGQCLTWITWVNEGERKLIWLRAHGESWRSISRETGFPKSSAQRYWFTALAKIAEKLENGCGL